MSMISYPRSQEVRATSRNNLSKQSFLCFENILSIQTRTSMLAKEGLMEQDSHNASKKASTTKKIPQSLTRLNAHKTTRYLPNFFVSVVHTFCARTLQRFTVVLHATELELILPCPQVTRDRLKDARTRYQKSMLDIKRRHHLTK